MKWNQHYEDVPEGAHAFLGASKYSWLNYTPEKLTTVYMNHLATLRGTELHNFANHCIRLKQKLPKSKKTLNSFVNDAIGYGMRSEQPLYFSPNCFGTTDAISFKNNLLRIHDLKTGVNPASIHQLEIYAGLFCLEYGYDPNNIDIELRIYQNDEIVITKPDPLVIWNVMDTIIAFDQIIEDIKEKVVE